MLTVREATQAIRRATTSPPSSRKVTVHQTGVPISVPGKRNEIASAVPSNISQSSPAERNTINAATNKGAATARVMSLQYLEISPFSPFSPRPPDHGLLAIQALSAPE